MDKKLITLRTEDCVERDDNLYFFAENINALCEMELKTGKVSIIGSIPEENIVSKRLCAKMISWNEELILAPMNAEKIWRFNLKDHTWKGIKRKTYNEDGTLGEIYQAVLYNNEVFFIGCFYPAVIVLNLLDNRIEYLEEPYEFLKEEQKENEDCFFRVDYAKVKNDLYMASCVSNVVMKLDMDTHKIQMIEVGDPGNRYVGIAWDGTYFWLAPRLRTSVVRWDGESECEEVPLPAGYKGNTMLFSGVVSTDEGIVFPARFGECGLIIKDSEKMDFEEFAGKYSFYKKCDSGRIVSFDDRGCLRIIEPDGNTIEYACEMDQEEFLNHVKRNGGLKLLKNTIIQETFMSVSDFCELIVDEPDVPAFGAANTGRKIWEMITDKDNI